MVRRMWAKVKYNNRNLWFLEGALILCAVMGRINRGRH